MCQHITRCYAPISAHASWLPVPPTHLLLYSTSDRLPAESRDVSYNERGIRLQWGSSNLVHSCAAQEMRAPVRVAVVTAPALVIMGRPSKPATRPASVFSSGCTSSHIFFLSTCACVGVGAELCAGEWVPHACLQPAC